MKPLAKQRTAVAMHLIEDAINERLARSGCQPGDMAAWLGLSQPVTTEILKALAAEGELMTHGGGWYFRARRPV